MPKIIVTVKFVFTFVLSNSRTITYSRIFSEFYFFTIACFSFLIFCSTIFMRMTIKYFFYVWLYSLLSQLPLLLIVQVDVVNGADGISSSFNLPRHHMTYNETVTYLKTLQANYPHLVQLLTIGKSVEHRDLWVIRLSANTLPTIPSLSKSQNGIPTANMEYYLHKRILLRPTVRLVGAIHGDEALGKHLLLSLTEYLVMSYSKDVQISRLLNLTDIELLPLMNPDGFEVAKEGDCLGVRNKIFWNGRENARGIDLDSNFIAYFDNKEAQEKLEPETLAMMTWMVSNPSFVLAGSIHTGSMVISYPYDGQSGLTPDNALFKKLAINYVFGYKNSSLFTQGCLPNEEFINGTVMGNVWSKNKSKYLVCLILL